MTNYVLKNRFLHLIIFLVVVGSFFRFYNFNWGYPYYFHPDERNIASSVTQLSFPDQMNPHFFAYGSLPIYAIYFTGLLSNFVSTYHVTFEQAIIISRIFSVIFSIGIIPLVYLVGKKLKSEGAGIVAAILTTFSVGFIQFAHFGTVEMWNAFLSLLLFYISIIALDNHKFKMIVLLSLIFALLLAIKISNLALFPLPILIIFLSYSFKKHAVWYQSFFRFVLTNLFFIFIASIVYAISNPFTFLSFTEFQSSMTYESDVALGKLPVFYTAEFFDQVPILFQFTKIYPFLINPLLTLLFIPSLTYILFAAFKKSLTSYLLFAICYLLLFLPNSFVFTKWTRYIVPTLPFVYIAIAITLLSLPAKNIKNEILSIKFVVFSFVSVSSIIFAISYFITAFVQEDSRVIAAKWAKENMNKDSKILSEVYDLGITPFNDVFHYSNITLFNFYDLDNKSPDATMIKLNRLIDKSDFIVLPSQRILKPRLQNPKKFPIGNLFYQKLFTGNLGFVKIYQTPCDIWCKIIYLNDPLFSFEQTANVFERPIVMIFKKQ